jgi:hypothetical protein
MFPISSGAKILALSAGVVNGGLSLVVEAGNGSIPSSSYHIIKDAAEQRWSRRGRKGAIAAPLPAAKAHVRYKTKRGFAAWEAS